MPMAASTHSASQSIGAAVTLKGAAQSKQFFYFGSDQSEVTYINQALAQDGGCVVFCEDVSGPEKRFIDEALAGISGAAEKISCIVLGSNLRTRDIRRLIAPPGGESPVAIGDIPVLAIIRENSICELERVRSVNIDDFCAVSEGAEVLKTRIRALLRRQALSAEHARVLKEFRRQEFELVEARAAEQTALARAALAAGLERQNELLRKTQSQLVQSAKMAALGELVAGIAHEINNPLSYALAHIQTVANMLDQLQSPPYVERPDLDGGKFDKAWRRAGDAIDGLERVAALIVKLRTFSRLDEGVFKIADLRECVEATLPLIQHRLGEKISVVTSYEDDNALFCAPGMINQVILNLLSNAIDAVGEQGAIQLRTSRAKDEFCLTVGDSGNGVAPENLDRLFEPFFTTKEVGKGTGLGLAVSYKIVQSHGGEIKVGNSALGGAEFVVSIPTNLIEQPRKTTNHG